MTERIRPELMTCEDVVGTGRYPYTGRLGILTAEDRRNASGRPWSWSTAEDLADWDFSEISDGQRQRILLARALCQEPEVIVLDEPTSFLDIRHKLELLSILKDMVRRRGSWRWSCLFMSWTWPRRCPTMWSACTAMPSSAMGPPEEIFTSDYIMELYGATRGSYNADFGCLEMEPARGKPEIFVIGGGGSGIPVYRQLQRRGIPFTAGVLQENDVDYPVAKALAVEVIGERSFEPIGESAFARAAARMKTCGKVLCCLREFGTMNGKNRELMELAKKAGTLTDSL